MRRREMTFAEAARGRRTRDTGLWLLVAAMWICGALFGSGLAMAVMRWS